MKVIIKRKEVPTLGKCTEFRLGNISGSVWKDGGCGHLVVDDPRYTALGGYCSESGTHKQRVNEVLRLAKFYGKAARDLKRIEKAIRSK